jgi:hypothetical protein
MTKPYEIGLYRTAGEKEPYTKWEENLDKSTMARIDARFARIREAGNIGNCDPVGMVFMNSNFILAQVIGFISVWKRILS